MRNIFFLLFLVGCASQPTEAQMQLLNYFAKVCEQQGIDPNDLPTMRGCIRVQIAKASAEYGRGGYRPNAGEELGRVLQTQPRGTNCSHRPDGLGGIQTTCQ